MQPSLEKALRADGPGRFSSGHRRHRWCRKHYRDCRQQDDAEQGRTPLQRRAGFKQLACDRDREEPDDEDYRPDRRNVLSNFGHARPLP